MKTETKHTPSPWETGPVRTRGTGKRSIFEHYLIASGKIIGRIVVTNENAKEDAAFIVLAVNAHEDLLNCCKGLAETLEDEFNLLESRVEREEVIASIRRIITKAEDK